MEAVVERQQRRFAGCDDDGLVLDGQDRRARRFQSGRLIGNRAAPPPFRHRLWVDAVVPGGRPQALLTPLYGSTDRLRRCGGAGQGSINPAYAMPAEGCRAKPSHTLNSGLLIDITFMTHLLESHNPEKYYLYIATHDR